MTEFSNFFTPDDIIEVHTPLKNEPFKGHFVSYDKDYIWLCDDAGNKAVIPTCQIMYMTSHKPTTPQPHNSTTHNPQPTTHNSQPTTPDDPLIIKAESASSDDGSDLFTPLESPAVKVIGNVDLDEINRRNNRKKKDEHSGRYVDPLQKLMPDAMGSVKRTGPKFGFISPYGEESDRCYQTHNVLGRIFPGDEVLFMPYDHPKGPQARTVMKVCSVAEMIDKMEEMRYERYGKSQIADMVAMLKSAFPDNDLVAEALRDSGFDRYKVRERIYTAAPALPSETPAPEPTEAEFTESESPLTSPETEDTIGDEASLPPIEG